MGWKAGVEFVGGVGTEEVELGRRKGSTAAEFGGTAGFRSSASSILTPGVTDLSSVPAALVARDVELIAFNFSFLLFLQFEHLHRSVQTGQRNIVPSTKELVGV